MSFISLLLHTVHDSVHTFTKKLNYSEPKIYSGGIDISRWSSLSKTEQKTALAKKWYLYYSYRDPKTGKLKRQINIKGEANKFKTKQKRYAYLKVMQQSLLELLSAGFSPYKDNTELEQSMFGVTSQTSSNAVIEKRDDVSKEESLNEITVTVKDAFKLGLETKRSVLNNNSFSKYKSRIHRFSKWLKEKDIYDLSITSIDKKLVIQYLNSVLQDSSARNRNNTRTDISSLFQVLEDNELIIENFVKKINVLKSVPKRNKTYTPKLQKQLYDYLEVNDKTLLLFIKFISYNFLRPIEVCRLRVEDVDLNDKKLYVKAKNSPVKIKIIPDILLKDLPDLKAKNSRDFLFTQNGLIGKWEIEEDNKRDFFTKKFKKIKDHFDLGKEYGLYSFRHTFITKLYQKLRKSSSPFVAKSQLMLITGHATMKALDSYLRDIDAELPEDYSELLNDS